MLNSFSVYYGRYMKNLLPYVVLILVTALKPQAAVTSTAGGEARLYIP
jgi:hypothetical protein